MLVTHLLLHSLGPGPLPVSSRQSRLLSCQLLGNWLLCWHEALRQMLEAHSCMLPKQRCISRLQPHTVCFFESCTCQDVVSPSLIRSQVLLPYSKFSAKSTLHSIFECFGLFSYSQDTKWCPLQRTCCEEGPNNKGLVEISKCAVSSNVDMNLRSYSHSRILSYFIEHLRVAI